MFFSPDQLHTFLATYGVIGVALFVGLEGMGIPLPGETVLILAAAYDGTHGGNIGFIIASAIAGAIIGDNIGFFIGRELGSRFLKRYGAKVGLTAGRIKLGQYLFMRHGTNVRAGPVYLNRFSASISGTSAGVKLPSGLAAG